MKGATGSLWVKDWDAIRKSPRLPQLERSNIAKIQRDFATAVSQSHSITRSTQAAMVAGVLRPSELAALECESSGALSAPVAYAW